MNIIEGNSSNFNDIINDDLVLVDFFATWCGPCRMLSLVLEELNSDRSDLKIVKIDVDQNSMIAKEYGIMSVPTLLLFKSGNLVSKQNGFMPKEELSSWIESNR